MRVKSTSSVQGDAYRAGAEIGDALRDIEPEVVLLFASMSYSQEFSDLFGGLFDALGNESQVVFGGTGDGIYETSRTAHYGVCALGLNSGGLVRWVAEVETGVAADAAGAARACARRAAEALGGEPDFALVLADGLKADGSGIARGIGSVLSIPFFGGLTGDDRQFTRTRILVNGQAVEDAVALLAGRGPLKFSLHAASGWTPVGEFAEVEEGSGNTVLRIGGRSPQEFVKEQIGQPLGAVDLGVVSLAAFEPGEADHFVLRSPSHFDPATGSISTFGRIETGTRVRVCTSTREEVIAAVDQALEGARDPSFPVAAAIVISCAGRKWLLDDRGDAELGRLFSYLERKIPLVGFPSFGEIGPFRRPDGTYTPVFFHNVTFVVCFLGG